MIANKHDKLQDYKLSNHIESAFHELNITKSLRQSGIIKGLGFSCALLFKLIFSYLSQQELVSTSR